MAGKHSLLSPSAAHRWLNCTAAPALEAAMPDNATGYAEEGTLAHAHCARKLKEFLRLPTDDEQRTIAQLSQYHSGEMAEYVDTYAAIVLEQFNQARAKTPDAKLLVEAWLDFGNYVPGAKGTADAVIIADGTMRIFDFKYGKGVKVEAEGNPQMMIYALGAYLHFSFDYRIEEVTMAIVQPRLDNLDTYTVTTAELLEWAESTLKPKAAEAYRGDGAQNPGPWCQFCRFKPMCRALAKLATDTAQADPKGLTPEELATEILPKLATIKTWLAGVEDHALALALGGAALPGWKLVEGRSIRKITQPEMVVGTLCQMGYKAEDLYKPMELRTLTELEKLVGKKAFATACAAYITKPKGKPTLAPESDKRKAIDPVAEDFKDF